MYTAIVLLPLLAAIVAGFFGRRIGATASAYLTSGAVLICAVLSWIAFFQVGIGGQAGRVEIAPWLVSGEMSVSWALRIDTLTAVMLVVVNSVSSLVHVYSIGYMSHDPHRPRFFAYLSLFTFAMLMLVTSDNFLQLFSAGKASALLLIC